MNLHFTHAKHFPKYFPNRQIIRLNLEKIHMLNAFIKNRCFSTYSCKKSRVLFNKIHLTK